MARIAGVFLLLMGLYATLFASDPGARKMNNIIDVANLQGQLGIVTLGVAALIITGAIDLSIGSVIGLGAVSFGILIKDYHLSPYAAMALVLFGGAVIGLIHGLLVTQLHLQSFLVTLCGLFVYRGVTRLIWDKTLGLNSIREGYPESAEALAAMRRLLIGKNADGLLVYPMEFFLMMALAAIFGALLHFSIYGRYAYAIGHNEQAARYAGIRTPRYRIAGFVLCSVMASLAGVLLMLNDGSVFPSNVGEGQELFAITAAVLGGCSLRGGDGTAVGIVLGAMVLKVLENLINFLEIPDAAQKAVIGLTLLFGTLADEFIRGDRRRRGRIAIAFGIIIAAIVLMLLARHFAR